MTPRNLAAAENYAQRAISAFGERLREVRLEKAVTQEKLALSADMDQAYLSGIERGVRNPSLRNIAKLAWTLEISLGELFASVHPQSSEQPASTQGARRQRPRG